jgi:uncharacterized protein (TIGR03083 family)
MEDGKALRADLDAAHAALKETVAAGGAWGNESPNPGWSARDLLAHLVSAETGNLTIARRILAGEGEPVEGFDLDRWNARQIEKMGPKEPDALLADLEAARRETVALLASLSPADLEKAGHRTTGEPTTVAGVFRQIINHQRAHTAEIRATLG